jgi:hypothetical protein
VVQAHTVTNPDALAKPDGFTDAIADPDGVTDAIADSDGITNGDTLADPDPERHSVGDDIAEGVGRADRQACAGPIDFTRRQTVPDSDALIDSDGITNGDTVAETECDLDAERRSLDIPESECYTDTRIRA